MDKHSHYEAAKQHENAARTHAIAAKFHEKGAREAGLDTAHDATPVAADKVDSGSGWYHDAALKTSQKS